jgi:hypothetical protein
LSSGKYHRAVQYKFTDISGDHTASVFKDEEEDKQVKGKEAEECLLLSSCLVSLVHNSEDGGSNNSEMSVKFSLTVRHNISENGGLHELRNLKKYAYEDIRT